MPPTLVVDGPRSPYQPWYAGAVLPAAADTHYSMLGTSPSSVCCAGMAGFCPAALPRPNIRLDGCAVRRSDTTIPPRHLPAGSWYRNWSFFSRSPNSSLSGRCASALG